MIIYEQENSDGLSEKISGSFSIAYNSLLSPVDIENNKSWNKISASFSDPDLYYVQSILVSSSWNRNDDIFDKQEIWVARKTPEDKPTNLEHDENTIIGHIISNWTIDDDGKLLPENINIEELPNKFHIVTGSVIYKSYSTPELRDRASKLIAEIEQGTKYVSMECYFNGFDYGLIDKVSGQYKILARNNDTAYLTKYLRAYGGQGEHDNYKIGRVLRNITFSGKGFVDKPANPDSIIFHKEIITKANIKNEHLSNLGVSDINPTINADMEKNIMNENLEKEVADINKKLDTVSASCADQVEQARSLASELQQSNQQLEAAMKEKDEMLKKEKTKSEELQSAFETTLSEKTVEFEEAAKKWKEEKAVMEEDMKKVKSELDSAMEAISAYKMKEEEMAKKDKMLKRKASLAEAGLEDDVIASTLEKFENIDDEAFEVMASLFVSMAAKTKKEEKAMMNNNPKLKKMMASEETELETALDTVETDDTVSISVGNDELEAESSQASIRAELVEFVSARLGKTSK